MPDEHPAEEELDEKKTTKKGCRGCLVRLGVLILVFLLFLGGGLLWLNGPGLPFLAKKFGPDLLQKAGFEGDFAISGSLFAGPTIDSISLKSETSPLKSLEAKNLSLKYSLQNLLNKKVDSLTADSLAIDLDLSQSDPNAEPKPEKKPSNLTLKETLAKFRDIALHPEIAINRLDLHVHKGDQNFYKIENGSLMHESQAEDFFLNVGTLTDFQNEVSTPPVSTITWAPETLGVERLPFATDLSIPQLTFTPEPMLADGRINIFGSELELNSNLKNRIDTRLINGPADLSPFLKFAPNLSGYNARLSDLTLKAKNFDKEFSAWQLDLLISADDLIVDGRKVPRTTLTVNKKGLTSNTVLTFKLPNLEPTIAVDSTFAKATAQKPAEAWKFSNHEIRTEFRSLASLLAGLAPALQLPTPPDGWPEGRAEFTALLNLEDGKPTNSSANLSFDSLNWAGAKFRSGSLQVLYPDADSPIEALLKIDQTEASQLRATANYDTAQRAYDATFEAVSFNARTLQPFIRLSAGDFPIDGTINLAWKGQGSLKDNNSHVGNLAIDGTRLIVKKQPVVKLDLVANYEGLSNITLQKLDITQSDQRLQMTMNWDGKRVTLPSVSIHKAGRNLLTGSASLPYELGQEPSAYFSDEDPWSLKINADRLNISETAKLFALPLPEGLQGIVTIDTFIDGSPAKPTLSGRVRLDDFSLAKVKALPTTDVSLSWASVGETLNLNGIISPEGRNDITISADTAFRPKVWAEDPQKFLGEEFTAKVQAPNVDLAPFADLVPIIQSLRGTGVVEVTADGTFRKPNLRGLVDLDIPRARFKIERFKKLRETNLRATFQDNTVRIEPSTLSVDGGIFELSGTVGLGDTSNPVFDIKLLGDKALLWRDDNINARADADLRLVGALKNLALSGEIGIVESLFYKDIELLPINMPVSIPKAPKLPSLSKPKAVKTGSASALPIPPPFGNCRLNLRAYTKDPFLVRGNLTDGLVEGEILGTGVLSNPQLSGVLTINEFSAALPFSTLIIDGGKAIFTPAGGFIPSLDIKATSQISSYEVNLYVAGKATKPNVSFAANPPLPENEVITLLATGTTSAGLEDSEAARGKAFQLLIEQIRRAPPGSPLYPLARFAEPLKDVEIQVAGADPFTGKRRNSVTLPLPDSERWAVTASVDSESNTRGLVIYLLRFN